MSARLTPLLRNLMIFTLALALVLPGALVPVSPFHSDGAMAQRRGISLVRDAEIEALIRDYARPLMRAGGLRRGSVQFRIVNDTSFNAFVSGRGMFINLGLLLRSGTPGEVIGVVAHELGHIIGGHQVRLQERMRQATRIAQVTTLLGLGLSAAGAATGSGELGRAGFGIAAGGNTAALRGLLQYRRSEETAADRTAATLLEKSKQSGAGMLQTFRRLGQDAALLGKQIDPYTLSHPLPRQRLSALTTTVERSRYFNRRASPALRERHDMVRAKIAAYSGGQRYARALLNSNRLSENARLYGRAIVTFLYGSPRKALPMIDRLIKRMPNNPYVHEMRGEILLRSAKPKQAAASLRKAIKLDKTSAGFIRVQLGHALVESGGRKNLLEAVTQLRKGIARDPSALAGYQYLARAYAELGRQPDALLASAELAIRAGQKRQAKNYASRAQQGFKRGSPPWLRAQDILQVR
ncbi:MAG: M48 family metalloprotease [Pseudomonadota bacterium]